MKEIKSISIMKKMLALSLGVMMTLTGCVASISPELDANTTSEPPFMVGKVVHESTPSAAATASEPTVSAAEPMQSLNVIHEFGNMQSFVEYKENLSCTIAYPSSNIPSIDAVFQEWAQERFDNAQQEIDELRQNDASNDIKGKVTFYYHSFLTNQRFASVEEIGDFTYTGQENPLNSIETFNIDLAKETFLTKEDVFAPNKMEDVLHLLWDKVNQINPEYSINGKIDEEWLDHFLIRPAGIEIILEEKHYLPFSAGSQRILLKYDELGDAFMLAGDMNAPAETSYSSAIPDHGTPSEATQTQETTMTAHPDGTQAPAASDSEARTDLISFQSDRVVDPDKPMVALTFDDGPSKTTPKILALLDQYQGRATFCVVGNRVGTYESTLKQIDEQGSEIASHTWDHKKLPSLSAAEIREELQSTNDIVKEISGEQIHWLRPPYGSVNDEVKSVTKEMDMAIVQWTIDTLDWETRDAKKTYDSIMSEVEDGSIILCHDLHKETGDAMELVIPELAKRGYQLVTVSELITIKGNEIEAGKVYR